jgi:uncharacterized protein
MANPLLEIPEIARLSSGVEILRIPCELDVPFTRRVRALVDTPEFQRLRQISQLGLVSLVYPGATHARFEHVLGVFHNTLRYVAQLAKDSRFAALVSTHDAEVLLVASLLHDLGHWPFCHPIEDLGLGALPPHEALAAEFLGDDSALAQVLRSEWAVEPVEVLDVLRARTDSPTLRLLRSILSGPIDVDKMDYLERDSLHCGVPYGRHFDKQRLIQSLVLNERGDGLAITSKGKTAAELMVFARYVMFSEVYWHHTVRAAAAMFARAFHELHREIDLRAACRQSERELIDRLRNLGRGTPAEPLLEGLFGPTRVIYKRVTECTPYIHGELFERLARRPFAELSAITVRLAARLSQELGQTIGPCDLLIDAPPREKEIQFNVDIFFAKEGVYRPLHAASPVVASLAREQFDDYVKRVRLFAHPSVAKAIAQWPGLFDLLREES